MLNYVLLVSELYCPTTDVACLEFNDRCTVYRDARFSYESVGLSVPRIPTVPVTEHTMLTLVA